MRIGILVVFVTGLGGHAYADKVLVAKQVDPVKMRKMSGQLRKDVDDVWINSSSLHRKLGKVEVSYEILHGSAISEGRQPQESIDKASVLHPGERLIVGQGKHNGFKYDFAVHADGLGRARPEYHVAAFAKGDFVIGGQQQVQVRDVRENEKGAREIVAHWWSGSGSGRVRKTVLIPVNADGQERTFRVGSTHDGPVLVTVAGEKLTGLVAPGWRQKPDKE
jgi:hypothetical protein